MTNNSININFGELTKKLCQWFASLNSTAKYTVLLISLLTLTWTPAFYGNNSGKNISWNCLIIVLTLLAGILAVSKKKRVVLVGSCLAVLTLAIIWSATFFNHEALNIAGDICMAFFFAFTASMILFDIWTTQGVTSDTIVGSLCAYLLIGATWAFLYLLTETFIPGSFHFTALKQGQEIGNIIHTQNYPLFMYYSFVTLCSLGYGEIIPIKSAGRMLATGEVIIGQFYMAVFVAKLISSYLNQARKTDKN